MRNINNLLSITLVLYHVNKIWHCSFIALVTEVLMPTDRREKWSSALRVAAQVMTLLVIGTLSDGLMV